MVVVGGRLTTDSQIVPATTVVAGSLSSVLDARIADLVQERERHRNYSLFPVWVAYTIHGVTTLQADCLS